MALEASGDRTLASFAARAAKEAAYHLRHSGEWVLRLGGGTDESRRRMQAALGELWIFTGELFETDDLVRRLVEARVVFDPERLHAPWREEVLEDASPKPGWRGRKTRRGCSEAGVTVGMVRRSDGCSPRCRALPACFRAHAGRRDGQDTRQDREDARAAA